MLNYIWAGLIILSLFFAVRSDLEDERRNRFRNGLPFPLRIELDGPYHPEASILTGTAVISGSHFAAFYGEPVAERELRYPVRLLRLGGQTEIRLLVGPSAPGPWEVARTMHNPRTQDEIRGRLRRLRLFGDRELEAEAVWNPVRFVKVRAVAQAALDLADTAVEVALGLIWVMALWLGLLRIAESGGIIRLLVRGVEPLLRPLFPNLPRGHPALGAIALNITANILGLGNAATPMGIKAMEELQKLNPRPEVATHAMCMFLAINTSSVQLLPPATLVALMGLGIGELMLPITLATLCSTLVGIAAAWTFARLKPWRDEHI